MFPVLTRPPEPEPPKYTIRRHDHQKSVGEKEKEVEFDLDIARPYEYPIMAGSVLTTATAEELSISSGVKTIRYATLTIT